MVFFVQMPSFPEMKRMCTGDMIEKITSMNYVLRPDGSMEDVQLGMYSPLGFYLFVV